MKTVSLKDYAEQKRVSYEAVRQQVIRYKKELGNHIIRDGRQQFLDEEAVAFLDEKRQKNPVTVIQQDKNEQIEVVNAEEEISCDESPVEAIRKKKDSSMVVALKMVKDKTADAFVSAGSSGAILVGGQFVVGRIKGIKRAPLGAVMPTAKGPMLLVDAGANMDICFSLHRWDLSIWKMFLESRTQELDLSMSVWKKPKEISW